MPTHHRAVAPSPPPRPLAAQQEEHGSPPALTRRLSPPPRRGRSIEGTLMASTGEAAGQPPAAGTTGWRRRPPPPGQPHRAMPIFAPSCHSLLCARPSSLMAGEEEGEALQPPFLFISLCASVGWLCTPNLSTSTPTCFCIPFL
ncbi:hypothetical protein VPH35_072568 [Triticum aestivum]